MANNNAPFGLRYVRTEGSAAPSHGLEVMFVPSGYGTALYVGDAVVVTGTSNTTAAGFGKQFDAGTLREINKITAGDSNKVTGVIEGFEPNPDGLGQIYNSASTARVVYVRPTSPNDIYEIQADATAAIAATDISSNANLIITTAGSTVTGLSGTMLDTSSMTTTATYQLKILGVSPKANNALGTNAILLVKINNSTEANITAGI